MIHAEGLTHTFLVSKNETQCFVQSKTGCFNFNEATSLLTDPYVKVSLMCEGRRLKKRKTTTKKNTLNPVYNEAIIFDIPPENVDQVSLCIAVMDYDRWVEAAGPDANLQVVIARSHLLFRLLTVTADQTSTMAQQFMKICSYSFALVSPPKQYFLTSTCS